MLDCKKLKIWSILNLQTSSLAPTSGNSLVVCRVSPGRIIVVLNWKKNMIFFTKLDTEFSSYLLEETRNNISIAFSCVSCPENGCYCVVSAGQLSFDCRCCCHMQGSTKIQEENKQRTSRAEQPLKMQMWFARRPGKICQKNPLWGTNVQEIWVATEAQSPSD